MPANLKNVKSSFSDENWCESVKVTRKLEKCFVDVSLLWLMKQYCLDGMLTEKSNSSASVFVLYH